MAEYPAIIKGSDIVANLDGEHYNIASPLAAKDLIKSLPGAKWDHSGRVWQVKKRWHGKISAMIAARDAELADERDRIETDAAAISVDLAAFAWCSPSKKVAGAWVIRTPYIENFAARMRALGGEWVADAKAWRIPVARTADLKLAAAALDTIIAPALAQDAVARKAAEDAKAARAAAYAAEREDADRAGQERRMWRVLCHAGYNPTVGTVVKYRGAWRVIEGHGKWFRAGDDISSFGHPDLTGDQVRYAYTRTATATEIEAAETAEAEQKLRAERAQAQRVAIAAVVAGEPAPDTGAEPAGEVIWSDTAHEVAGYRRWIVLGDDGWLYHLTYDGSDGAAWGQYNAGYNTRAHRILADPDLVARIGGGEALE